MELSELQIRLREKYFEAVSRRNASEIVQEVIQEVTQKQEPTIDSSIKGNALLILIAVARFPFKTKMEIYSQVNLDGRKGKNAVDDLEKKGFIKSHKRAKKPCRGGGHPEIIELLKPAKNLLKSFDIEQTSVPGRGGILHNIYAHDFGEFQRKKGCKEIFYDTRFETPEGTKDVDCSGVMLSGLVWVSEVISSGSVSHNADCLRKSSLIKEASEVYGLFEDKRLLEKVNEELGKMDEKESLSKVRMMFVGDIYQD